MQLWPHLNCLNLFLENKKGYLKFLNIKKKAYQKTLFVFINFYLAYHDIGKSVMSKQNSSHTDPQILEVMLISTPWI